MLTRIYLTLLSCFSLLFLVGCATEPTNQSPIAVIDASATNGEAPLTVTLSGSRSSDPDGTIVDYRWDLGDGNTKNGVSVTHTYSQAGSFTIKLTVTDNQGAVGEAVTFISVSVPNQKPVAIIDASTTEGEAPLTVTFDGSRSYDPDGAIASYRWELGDGNIANGVSATHTYYLDGSFLIRLIVTDDRGAIGIATTSISVTGTKPNCPRNSADNGKLRLTLRSVSVTSEIVGSEPWVRAVASQGNQFVIVDVLMQALVNRQPVDPSGFQIEDEDRVAYSPHGATYVLENPFQNVILDSGQKKDGKIAFEVKLKARQLKLIYKPSLFFGSYDDPNIIVCFSIP